jgi:energy-coupling factor transporter transmembrane protein EcfT
VSEGHLYRRTQVGWIIIAVFLVVAVIVAVANVFAGFFWFGPLIVTLLLGIGLLFSTLTVVVDEDYLRIAFGPGLLRRSWKLADLESASIVRNRWFTGWGIRYQPGVTIYNVSGFDAVEIKLLDGRRYRIGTDDAAGLLTALVEARREAA